MDKERRFFLNFETLPVHGGDQWVGIAIGLEELKAKYKKTLEELRKDKGENRIYYDIEDHHLKVYEYTEEAVFRYYPTKELGE